MKIHSKYAVISYCADLTKPNARSIPFALVAVGGEENNDAAFVLSISPNLKQIKIPELDSDRMSKAILSDFQDFLNVQIKASLQESNATSLLVKLEKRLRNTIHIETIKDIEFELDVKKNLVTEATDVFFHLFDDKIRNLKTRQENNKVTKTNQLQNQELPPELTFRTISSLAHAAQ